MSEENMQSFLNTQKRCIFSGNNYPIKLEQQAGSSSIESVFLFKCAFFFHEIIGFDFAVLALAGLQLVKVALDEVPVVSLVDFFVG